jgi:nucleotide-binding universal stress UspA family protein
MKILLAVDDSKFASELVRAVVRRVYAENTEVLVLHVLQQVGPPPPQMAPGYAPELAEENQLAQGLVQRVAVELRDAGFSVQTMVGIGDVREDIIDMASDWGAELIVVGSHGQRGIQRFLLGSVSEFVARHAQCSVEIVRTATSH